MYLIKLQKTLQETGILDAIRSVCAQETECFLVGGAIRDCLRDKEVNDFDFCMPVDPVKYVEQIAAQLGATWFVLDAERGHSRFVLKQGDQRVICDFALFRAPSLESDLRKRDFTINAMACSCKQGEFELIDPLDGQKDLTSGTLRVCSEYSFQEDPLRCLKGIRHIASLGLEFAPDTLQQLTDSAPQIDQVASERIRTELAKAIACSNPVKTFELLEHTGLLRELFGHSDQRSFAAAIELLLNFESITQTLKAGACGQIVSEYLADLCEEHVTIDVALKMATFFSGYRPVALKSILQALRFSKRTVNLIEQLQSINADTMSSIKLVAAHKRSRARWLSETGSEPLASAIFMALLAPLNPDNMLQIEIIIDSFASCAVNGKLGELVDGNWITDELGVEEGPVIGQILELLHRAELDGNVTNQEEAQQWLLTNQKVIDKDFQSDL